jgi:hypothetical protein
MTEAEWRACEDPGPMLTMLNGRLSERKSLLIGCACCRLCWSDVVIDEFHRATEILERVADGIASKTELAEGYHLAVHALGMCTGTAPGIQSRYEAPNSLSGAWAVRELAARDWDLASSLSLWDRLSDSRRNYVAGAAPFVAKAIEHLQDIGDSAEVGRRRQAQVVHDIVGNPFRPSTFASTWRTEAAVSIARQLYASRDFSGMPTLADALRDAGCEDADVLSHCRGMRPHFRGCWVIDSVLCEQ